MNQHVSPSPSVGAVSASPVRARWIRLLVAFLLGLTSPFFFAPLALQPRWWQPVIVLAALLVATLLGAILVRDDSGGRTKGRMFLELAGIVLVIGGLGGAFVFLRLIPIPAVESEEYRRAYLVTNVLTAALVPILVGMAGALVAQRYPSALLALGGAELGWLGAYIANIVVVLLSPVFDPTRSNPEGVGTTVAIVAAVGVVGFVLAALGSLIGWGLRVFGGGQKR